MRVKGSEEEEEEEKDILYFFLFLSRLSSPPPFSTDGEEREQLSPAQLSPRPICLVEKKEEKGGGCVSRPECVSSLRWGRRRD